MNLVAMALCGGLGAVCRFVLDSSLRSRLTTSLPVGTLVVNVLGSLLLGLLAGGSVHGLDPDVRLVLGTGFCGGFTTFSTASVECARLAQARRPLASLGYLLGTAVLCLSAAATGMALA